VRRSGRTRPSRAVPDAVPTEELARRRPRRAAIRAPQARQPARGGNASCARSSTATPPGAQARFRRRTARVCGSGVAGGFHRRAQTPQRAGARRIAASETPWAVRESDQRRSSPVPVRVSDRTGPGWYRGSRACLNVLGFGAQLRTPSGVPEVANAWRNSSDRARFSGG
jgi:hypothetical protein